MKIFTRILIWGLLLFPMYASAQTATEKRTYEVEAVWKDLWGYSEWISYRVPVYYDNDDNVVKHGLFSINHRSDQTARFGEKCILTYVVSGNYVKGKLNGVLSVEKAASVTQGLLKTKATLNFANGVPTGTWTFMESATRNGQTLTLKCTITINDGHVVSYNYAKNNFKINSDGTFSGTLGGDVYKKCLNTTKFIRKTGEITKVDESTKSLINAFVAGTMTESDLLAKGFALERGDEWMSALDVYNEISYFASKLEVGHYMKDASSCSLVSIIRATEKKSAQYPALILKRVNVISTEDVVAKANTIKNAYTINERAGGVCWNDIEYYFGTNKIEISGNTYYFADDARLKIEEVVKEAVELHREKKRIEEERLAEQKRLQEIEKQKAKIQMICDYLVAQATSTSISYDDQVYRYFDSEGLDEYWRLDLGKVIKPFCKIVDCKLVSIENQGATNVAVLDITKFNKKGNITYRLPVTIVDGKILVTSINFSNATVVE